MKIVEKKEYDLSEIREQLYYFDDISITDLGSLFSKLNDSYKIDSYSISTDYNNSEGSEPYNAENLDDMLLMLYDIPFNSVESVQFSGKCDDDFMCGAVYPGDALLRISMPLKKNEELNNTKKM